MLTLVEPIGASQAWRRRSGEQVQGSSCKCTCVPLLCPTDEDRLKVEEVSGADYIHEKRVVKARIRKDTRTKAALRRLGGFIVGIFLTTVYALIVLFIKNYNLWFCLTTTVTLGLFLSLGMAFSLRVRITVLLMLPQIFSGQAKTMFLLIAFTLVVQGPTANIMENIQRSSKSMACGAQLALNKTKELTSKITKPLMAAVDALQKIGKKLRPASNRSNKFFHNLYDNIKHAEKVLRNMWAFITNIGDTCNEELEQPYIKCNKLFDEAKNSCFKVMSFMGFLCFILDVFRPLCGLARTLLSVVRNLKDQFDFNISVVHDFNMQMNASRNYYQVASAIMKEVKENMETYMEMLSMFSYSMVIVCVLTYIQALRYRRRYLTDLNHDNIYISREFIELDVMRVKQNRNALLPLSSSEGYEFIRPGSLTLTKREKKGYVFEIINVFRSLLVAMLMVVLDYVFYWVLDLVSHLMRGEVVARSPLVFSILVNGTGEINEIYKTIVSAFDVIQNSNITIQTTKCQVQPSEPDYLVYLLIGFLHGLTFFIAIFGIYMQRLKRYICAYYYPTREQMRICFLYNKLLTKRMYVEKSLLQSLRTNEADKGHTNILLILAAKCPCLFGWLANFLGAYEQYCIACAQICAGKDSEEYSSCSTFGCRAIYCRDCSRILNNVCILCMAPLVCVEAEDEEVDSSDDEKVTLMMEAMKSMKKEEKTKRKKLKKAVKHRLKEAIKRRQSDRLVKKYKESMASSDSGESDVDAGDDSGESDFEYQKSKADDSFDTTDWGSPSKTSLLDAQPIPLTNIQKKTTREDKRSRKERDMEKSPDCD
ncbi:DC-STAMP domain-containing protein 2 [Bufo bufo]|uniref:DC-STAMP domain-containing protein 2 n=1 Tax=Bufo bufo TaxID=8384 RepID=UPI001ABE2C88|nr:DC-STAMP domain-containing protein 2 [Bufo bufo]